MKKVLLYTFLTTFITSYGQLKKLSIADNKIGTIHCVYKKMIDLEKEDTIYFLSFLFQNAKYQQLIDTKSISFNTTNDSSEINKFCKDLKSAYAEMGQKSEITWNREKYTLNLYTFSNDLYIREEDSGYTILNQADVLLLIEWIERLGFQKK